MHPVIGILALISLTAFLARGQWSVWVVSALLVGGLYLVWRLETHRGLKRMLLRLRWFFLSIVMLYALFTPGDPVIAGLGATVLTYQGLSQGMLRVLNLVVIIGGVYWLLQRVQREDLARGVYWLLRPLRFLGLPPERLAVRLVLTLDTVTKLQAWQMGETLPSPRRFNAAFVAERAAGLFERVLARAEQDEPIVLQIGDLGSPTPGQWAGLLIFLSVLSMTSLSLNW